MNEITNQTKRVLIVGGVAGGATTAARLRRLSESMEIILFERGEFISFANCGLPYHVGGTISEREHLILVTPETMRQRFNVDVRVRNEVIRIDRERRVVTVRDLTIDRVYEEAYDHLVLSPGASPVRPPIPGIDLPGIFSLRNIPDMDQIIARAERCPNGRAVVVGGGFIGLEMAENLRHRGLSVTLVEMAEQVMLSLDRELAAILHQHMRGQGVDLRLKEAVKGFEQADGAIRVRLGSSEPLMADLVILAIGVRPEAQLAREAGLELGPRGGITVGPDLLTSDPAISAIGDVAEVPAFDGTGNTWVPLAGPANRQGRLLADRIAGRAVTYGGVQATSIAKVFDLTVAATGKGESALRRAGIEFQSIVTNSNAHAGYYPGALPITLKLLFSPEGKILGAQAVGYEGVDKRIDVLATALRLGAKVDDLAGLELAYAPPFSSAKDPVNIIGYAAGNVLRGDARVVDWRYVAERDPEKVALLDVREDVEWEIDRIEGAIHIPLGELRQRHGELPKEKEIVVYCAVGTRAHTAVRMLTQMGYRVANLSGGMRLYQAVRDDMAQVAGGPDVSSGQTGAGVGSQSAASVGGSQAGAGGSQPGSGVGSQALQGLQPVVAAQGKVLKLNACGLQCPGPIMQVYQRMKELSDGDILEVAATDPGFLNDIGAWCSRTGNTLIRSGKNGTQFEAVLRKGTGGVAAPHAAAAAAAQAAFAVANPAEANQDKTMVVFSADLDKAIASFIIANGAAAMGRKVTMFFTFWGLNILRKPAPVPTRKPFLETMFGWMMPRGTQKLGLSRMNMLGAGPKMIRYVMGRKGVTPLEGLIQQAKMAGVRLVACNMSMDIMGIRQEELIDGVELGGVASYLAAAEESNVNLFI